MSDQTIHSNSSAINPSSSLRLSATPESTTVDSSLTDAAKIAGMGYEYKPIEPIAGEVLIVLQSSEETLAADKTIKAQESIGITGDEKKTESAYDRLFTLQKRMIAYRKANAELAEQLSALLGFNAEEKAELLKIVTYKSQELRDDAADLGGNITLQQAMHLIVHAEYERLVAISNIKPTVERP